MTLNLNAHIESIRPCELLSKDWRENEEVIKAS